MDDLLRRNDLDCGAVALARPRANLAVTACEAAAFVKEKDLVTVPSLCEETWRPRMMTPGTMRMIPYAAYSPSGIQVAYAPERQHEERHGQRLSQESV